MRGRAIGAFCCILLLSGCTGAATGTAPGADRRAAAGDELDPSGRPYDGPRGTPTSNPPADNNGARLDCHPEGFGTRCSRDQS